MPRDVTIRAVETLSCDAGWRPYFFVKLTASDGTVGWSEYDETFGPPGTTAAINKFAEAIASLPVADHETIFARLFNMKRMAFGTVVANAAGAIENALLDAKAKIYGVPCYELLGGKMRDRVRVYWSHSVAWRTPPRGPHYRTKPVNTLDDVRDLGREIRDAGFTGLKTNPIIFGAESPQMWSPGFGQPFQPDLNVGRTVISQLRAQLEALREGAGPDMDILLDLNFNARTEGFIGILRALEDLELFWVEIDHNDAEGLARIRAGSPFPISSCETLLGLRAFKPYFRQQSMDVAIIDAVWNGVWQSMKIANAAEAYDINVAPHNFYGHLATMMNVHFAAAVPNLRIMETDIDRLPWDEEIFPTPPVIEDSHILVPDTPGWGCDPDEAVIRNRPRKS